LARLYRVAPFNPIVTTPLTIGNVDSFGVDRKSDFLLDGMIRRNRLAALSAHGVIVGGSAIA